MTDSARFLFRKGLRDGIPICLGYFSVSAAFGIVATQNGIPFYIATLISATNLTSAGQFAAVSIITACGSLLELAITTLIINARYFLMSMSMSQKLAENMPLSVRMAIAFGVTDEIFAVSIEQEQPLTGAYMAGLILLPLAGWIGGTFVGATASTLLPLMVRSALGIMLYGMFVAIVVPPARSLRPTAITVIASMALSALLYYVPLFDFISSGWSIILCALLISAVMAWRFPIRDAEDSIADEVKP